MKEDAPKELKPVNLWILLHGTEILALAILVGTYALKRAIKKFLKRRSSAVLL